MFTLRKFLRLHLGFISLAIVLAVGTSLRSFQLAEIESHFPFREMGLMSLLFAFLLMGYGGWALRR